MANEASKITTRFWTFKQNNSGGIFDHDPDKGIGYAIAVEAVDLDHATARARKIVEIYPASYDCPCCGERWSLWVWPEDGEEVPELYGQPIRGGWGIPSYTHYLDGRVTEHPEVEAE